MRFQDTFLSLRPSTPQQDLNLDTRSNINHKTFFGLVNFFITHNFKCPFCEKRRGHFSSVSKKEDNIQTFLEKPRTAFKTHLMTYHENASEPSYSIARKNPESNSTFNKMVKAEMKKQPAQKCETCGLVCKSKLFHDRHVYTAHKIQVPQTCKICQDVVPDPKVMYKQLWNFIVGQLKLNRY